MHNHQQLHALPDAYETSLLDKTNDLLEISRYSSPAACPLTEAV